MDSWLEGTHHPDHFIARDYDEILRHGYSLQHYTIKEIIDPWLKKIHHPELLCTRGYDKGTVECRLSSKNNFKRKIPLIYTTHANIESYDRLNITWFEGNSTKLISGLNDSINFYILNLEQIGYYRVNYDRKNWQTIADHLQFQGTTYVPDITRAQLISDAFYFVTKRELHVDVFYKIIKFLETEKNYILWYPILNILSYTSAYLEYPESHSVGGLRTKLVDILNMLLDKLGYKIDEYDRNSTKALRLLAIKWACKLGHTGCRNATVNIVSNKISTNTSSMYEWEMKWIYAAGMMALNSNDWKQCFESNKLGIYDNMQYMKYLTYSEDDDIILHYLNLTLTHDLAERKDVNMPKLYLSLVKKHARKHRVPNYVLENYNETVTRYPDFNNGKLIVAQIIMNVYSEAQFEQVNNFTSIFKGKQPEKWTMYQSWINASRYRRDNRKCYRSLACSPMQVTIWYYNLQI